MHIKHWICIKNYYICITNISYAYKRFHTHKKLLSMHKQYFIHIKNYICWTNGICHGLSIKSSMRKHAWMCYFCKYFFTKWKIPQILSGHKKLFLMSITPFCMHVKHYICIKIYFICIWNISDAYKIFPMHIKLYSMHIKLFSMHIKHYIHLRN